jgi:glyoxylase-like metal-dependent hydrolase (beta-lactamase superfamily II)
MGDVLFNRMYPFIDLGSGGSIDGMIAAQKQALTMVGDATKIIPGHGPLANKTDLQENLAMLKTVREVTAAAISEGKDLEQLVAEDPLADLNEKWGHGFIDAKGILGFAYGSLTTE